MKKRRTTTLFLGLVLILSILLAGCNLMQITFTNSTETASTESTETASVDLVEKEKENHDLSSVESVFSAFTAALATQRVTGTVEGTSAMMDESLREEIEKSLCRELNDVESELQSDACKGKEFYFYFSSERLDISVAVETKEGCEGQYVDRFYVRN